MRQAYDTQNNRLSEATGRAIVRDPEVFLFDEPLSNLDAKLRVQADGGQGLRLAGGQACLACPSLPLNGGQGVLGIRPEHLRIGPPPVGRPVLHLRAGVDTVEALGAEYLIHLDADGHRLVLRQAAADRPPAAGDILDVHNADPAQWHWFDADSGRRLTVC